jgi:dipeptidyl aminopeptidase/acylaminoacyl peptidase
LNIKPKKHRLSIPKTVCVSAVIAVCGTIFACSGPTEVVAQQAGAASSTLPIDVVFKLREFQGLDRAAVSPDGRFVAYGVMTHPERGLGDGIEAVDTASGTPKYSLGVNLFMAEIATSRSRLVGTEAGNAIRGSWSPDSKQLAFYSDADGRLRLWVYEVASGQARKVTNIPIHAGLYSGDDPVWTSDGRSVLVPLMENTGTKEVIVPSVTSSSRSARAEVSTSGAEVARLKGPATATGANEARLQRLYGTRSFGLVTVATGAARIIIPASLERPREAAQFSPSGRFISYLSLSQTALSGPPVIARELVVCRTEDGAIEHTIKGLGLDAAPNLDGPYRWHPTEDRLFYLKQHHVSSLSRTADGSWHEAPLAHELGEVDQRIFETTRDGKALLLGLRTPGEESITGSLTPGLRRMAVVWLDGRPPKTIELPDNLRMKQLLVADRRTAWQPHLGSVTGLVRNDATFESAIVRLDLNSGAMMPLYSGRFIFQDDRRARPMVAAPADHSFIIGQLEGADRPPDLYRFGAEGKVINRVTEIEPRLSSLRFGPAELFETKIIGPNGEAMTVYTGVLMPPGTKRGDRVPAVATVYGGTSNALHLDRFGAQSAAGFPLTVLLTRGYAVLLLDAPMSAPGPGRRGNPIQDLVNAVVPQVSRAAELGYVNSRRVAVTGQSYGGYCTAALLSATPVFVAGVATSGLYDLPGGYDQRWTETGQGRMGTHPWDDLPRYLENSPYYRADRIKSPLLIVHGGADSNVNDAQKMFTALRRLDRTAQLAIYPGEGHTIHYWSLDHAVDATQRIVSFLDHYVKGPKPSPSP